MNNCELLISETEAAILYDLLNRAEHTKYGLITNWDEPYGISFEHLRRHVDIIKYSEEYVRQKEQEYYEKKRLEEEKELEYYKKKRLEEQKRR